MKKFDDPIVQARTTELDTLVRVQTRQLDTLAQQARYLSFLLGDVMKTMQELTAKIVELGQAESDYQDREKALVAALNAVVLDLQAKLDAAENVDTEPLINQLQGIIDAIPAAVPPVVPEV